MKLTKEQLAFIEWLTGYESEDIQELFEQFIKYKKPEIIENVLENQE